MTAEDSIFRELVTLEEAVNLVKGYLGGVAGKSEVGIEDAVGNISAENVFSKLDIPPHTRSEVDGYAVRSRDTVGADETHPVKLKLIGKIDVGEVFKGIVKTGECVEVSTGSAIPLGSDSVIPIEFTEKENGYIGVFKGVGFFENVLRAGLDFEYGDLIVGEGELITEGKLAALAAAGVRKVKVFKKPVIGIISTGDELVEPGNTVSLGKVFDVNTYLLASRAKGEGLEVKSFGIVRDKFDELLRKVEVALDQVDVLVLSGGSSVGVRDIVYKVFERLGSKLLFHGVLVRPGKPTGFGLINGKPVFCLPGNPVSAITSFVNIVLKPIRGEIARGKVKARLLKRVIARKTGREFIPLALLRSGEGLLAYPIHGSSGAVSRIYHADGVLEMPPGKELIEEGSVVEAELMYGEGASDLALFGEIDPVVRYLASIIRRETGLKINLLKEGGEEALIDAGRLGSMAALKSAGKMDLAGDWREVFTFRKVFGLYLHEEAYKKLETGKAIPLNVVSWPPWTIEYLIQKTVEEEMRLNLIGYISTSLESIKYVEDGFADGGFAYKVRDDCFLEVGSINMSIVASGKLSKDVFREIANIASSPETVETLKSRFNFFEL